MKARLEKRTFGRRFSLIFVLLLTAAAWTVSNSAAQQQTLLAQPSSQGTGETAVQPAQAPDSSGHTQVTQSGQDAAQTPRPEGAIAQQPVAPAPATPGQTSPGQAVQPAQALTAPAPPAAAQFPGLGTPQSPDTAAVRTETLGMNFPSEYVPMIQKANSALMSPDFTFLPIKVLDPFVPFITVESGHPGDDEEEQNAAPLTPLQKMSVSEIEKGLKAITWGELGKRAVIEDSTGRGYIVNVGTPAGERSGVITEISKDHLVIHQELWDRKAKKRFPQEFTVKLVKKMDSLKQ